MSLKTWRARLLLALGRQLEHWGQRLVAQAAPPTQEMSAAATVATSSSGQPPAHWLALLAQSEIPVHWLGTGQQVDDMPALSPPPLTFSVPATHLQNPPKEPTGLPTPPTKRLIPRFVPIATPTPEQTPNWIPPLPPTDPQDKSITDKLASPLTKQPVYLPRNSSKPSQVHFVPVPASTPVVTSDFPSSLPSPTPVPNPLFHNPSPSPVATTESVYVTAVRENAGTPPITPPTPSPKPENPLLFTPTEPNHLPQQTAQNTPTAPPFSHLPISISTTNSSTYASEHLPIQPPIQNVSESIPPIYNPQSHPTQQPVKSDREAINPTPLPVTYAVPTSPATSLPVYLEHFAAAAPNPIFREPAAKHSKEPLPHFYPPSGDRWPPLPAENDPYHYFQPMANRVLTDHWQQLTREQAGE